MAMVHCSPHKHCNRGNVAILAIQGSGNKNNVGQDKSFWAGVVDCTIACHLPIPEEENEDLSAPLHMYFVLPNPILPSRFGQERFVEAVIKGSAHNNYTHRILLSCRQQLIFLWQWICNLPSPLLTLHLLGVNSSKQFISRA